LSKRALKDAQELRQELKEKRTRENEKKRRQKLEKVLRDKQEHKRYI